MTNGAPSGFESGRGFKEYRCVRSWKPLYRLESFTLTVPLTNFLRLCASISVGVFLLYDFFLRQPVHQLIGDEALTDLQFDKPTFLEPIVLHDLEKQAFNRGVRCNESDKGALGLN